ncbi:hypothetical protein OV079_40490 [Nannocystis pusilla]|uniref:Uncharacterized protein n=1 Tax=Nannocystis pusilla TaxID=889268 RepID=A0A9X3J335_9BACT|nr:hypothetical protein [Nannocystis pusilla]MCY1011728.1 hypothetical protein [Nannocystis pusilla]
MNLAEMIKAALTLLESIDERLAHIRFGGDCGELRLLAHELLSTPATDRQETTELYYDFLSNMVRSIFLAQCDGTLLSRDKLRIFQLLQEDWSDEAAEGFRASMLTLLGLNEPLPGVPEWLRSAAQRQRDPAYAEAIRACADCPRTKPAV